MLSIDQHSELLVSQPMTGQQHLVSQPMTGQQHLVSYPMTRQEQELVVPESVTVQQEQQLVPELISVLVHVHNQPQQYCRVRYESDFVKHPEGSSPLKGAVKNSFPTFKLEASRNVSGWICVFLVSPTRNDCLHLMYLHGMHCSGGVFAQWKELQAGVPYNLVLSKLTVMKPVNKKLSEKFDELNSRLQARNHTELYNFYWNSGDNWSVMDKRDFKMEFRLCCRFVFSEVQVPIEVPTWHLHYNYAYSDVVTCQKKLEVKDFMPKEVPINKDNQLWLQLNREIKKKNESVTVHATYYVNGTNSEHQCVVNDIDKTLLKLQLPYISTNEERYMATVQVTLESNGCKQKADTKQFVVANQPVPSKRKKMDTLEQLFDQPGDT